MDIKRMHEMIEKLSECAKCEIDKGIENIDPCEMGQVTDMMKDLAEAMYYRTLMKAMEESSADETMEMFDRFDDGRRFYDNYRYANGRFAPKGRGTRRGYEEQCTGKWNTTVIWIVTLAECITQSLQLRQMAVCVTAERVKAE